MIKFNLHPHYENYTGHCQITYVSKNALNEKLIYCLQDNGQRFGGIRLMRCSQDGEPSHEVKLKDGTQVQFERVVKDEGKLGQLVNKWIIDLELKQRNKK